MQNDELLPSELDPNPSEEKETELDGPDSSESEPQGDDPLDAITDVGSLKAAVRLLPAYSEKHKQAFDALEDVDAIRAEAKKIRAIGNRHKKSTAPKPEKPKAETPSDTSGFMKKSDFELANQKKAVNLATGKAKADPEIFGVATAEELKTVQADILENWEQVRANYTPRRGRTTPEDIFEDIKDAYVLFNARRPKKTDKPDVAALAATTVTQGTGAGKIPATTPKSPPNFGLPVQPKEWYPTKKD